MPSLNEKIPDGATPFRALARFTQYLLASSVFRMSLSHQAMNVPFRCWLMDMFGISDVAFVVNLFGTGILAGVLFLSAVGLRPAAVILEPAQQIILRQHLINRLRTLMTPFMILRIIASGWF